MYKHLLELSELPKGFSYPAPLIKVISLGLINFKPWHIMVKNEAHHKLIGMQIRYSERILIPFARRSDNDDVACFELNKGEEVQIIHDFASSGYEQRGTYKSFWEWFRYVIEEMINFD